MQNLIYFILRFIAVLISAVEFVMFIRAILSFVMPDGDNTLCRFTYAVTEPFIIPVRAVLERFDFINDLPIDVSFMVTWILLMIIGNLLLF